MAANLRGDLLGAQADLGIAEQGWLSPLALWTGIMAGPIAWAFDLTVSFALVGWSCDHGHMGTLHTITWVSLAITAGGAVFALQAARYTLGDVPTDGGTPRQRARFMALLGLTCSALFAVAILAGAIPRWVLDACQ
jgi:hypothetical protein